MGGMRYGVSAPNVGPPGQLVALARAAEQAGWDGFFLWDHLHLDRGMRLEVHDPWVVLGAVAAVTERVRLGTLVTPLSRRRPWKLAKEVVTLDHLSGGRAVLGVGLGFPVGDDFAAFGEVADDRERADRLDEGLAIVDAVLRGDPVSVSGRHFQVDAELGPGAVQRPRPPIWVATMDPARRPLARAQRWDGVFPIDPGGGPVSPERLAAYLSGVAAPPGWEVVAGWAEGTTAEEYADAGATWLIESRWPSEGWYEELRSAVTDRR